MSDFIQRLMDEKQQLDEKASKLAAFIASEKFAQVDPRQQELLRCQHITMAMYSNILKRRLDLLATA